LLPARAILASLFFADAVCPELPEDGYQAVTQLWTFKWHVAFVPGIKFNPPDHFINIGLHVCEIIKGQLIPPFGREMTGGTISLKYHFHVCLIG
jgi:hypothetical protein